MKKDNILPIGVLARIGETPGEVFTKVKDYGLSHCQLASPPEACLYGGKSEALTEEIKKAIKETKIIVDSVFISFKGQYWDLTKGPGSVGFVPEDTRAERIARACRISSWSRDIGARNVVAHVGFIPEDRTGVPYGHFIDAMREFVSFCGSNGQVFSFETGQETVEVLKYTMEDIGLENIGVNFDPANLILYGMDDPFAVIKKLGRLITNVHCKDGVPPENHGEMGKETRLGDGRVDFKKIIGELYRIGYRGSLTIEREISGEQQGRDILHAKTMLEKIRNRHQF